MPARGRGYELRESESGSDFFGEAKQELVLATEEDASGLDMETKPVLPQDQISDVNKMGEAQRNSLTQEQENAVTDILGIDQNGNEIAAKHEADTKERLGEVRSQLEIIGKATTTEVADGAEELTGAALAYQKFIDARREVMHRGYENDIRADLKNLEEKLEKIEVDADQPESKKGFWSFLRKGKKTEGQQSSQSKQIAELESAISKRKEDLEVVEAIPKDDYIDKETGSLKLEGKLLAERAKEAQGQKVEGLEANPSDFSKN